MARRGAIPHLLGLDLQRLTFYHSGIERRLTDVHGHVIRDILTGCSRMILILKKSLRLWGESA